MKLDSTPNKPLHVADDKPVYHKNLSVIEMLKLGSVITDKFETVELYSFDLESMRWCSKPITAELSMETVPFAKGGFRYAYKATSKTPGFSGRTLVVKRYLASAIDIIHQTNQSVEDHTRKVVQMHNLAQNMCSKLKQGLEEMDCLDLYGPTLQYNDIFMGRVADEVSDHQWLTVEEFVHGDFAKYMNNDGTMVKKVDKEMSEKCQSLVHFTYERSKQQLIVVDMQGCCYRLFDPEIASKQLKRHENEEHPELLFSTGNLSSKAIDNFLELHAGNCNTFCTILELSEITKP